MTLPEFWSQILTDIPGASLKLFALMTPPAVLSAFLGQTGSYTRAQKNGTALRTSLAILVLALILYLWGAKLFGLFGFGLDAFRIGSGVLLFLSGLNLIREPADTTAKKLEGDISIVPLAIPLGLGPATIGAVTVMGAQATSRLEVCAGILSLFVASGAMYLLLRLADPVGKLLGRSGIAALARLTGLVLAALAAQVVFTGAVGFLK